MQQLGDNRHNVPPSYVCKMIIFFTPQGEILLSLGNQRLRVTLNELKAMFELWAQIAAAFEPDGTNVNGDTHAQ